MTGWSDTLAFLGLVDFTFRGKSVGKVPSWLVKDVLIIVLVGAGLLFALLVWAKYFRSGRKRKKIKPGAEAEIVYRDAARNEEEEEDAGNRRRKYKRRVRRRDHRSRNPTLAETGGLPPSRPGEPGNAPG